MIGNESGPICLAASHNVRSFSIYSSFSDIHSSKFISKKTTYFNFDKESDDDIKNKILNACRNS